VTAVSVENHPTFEIFISLMMVFHQRLSPVFTSKCGSIVRCRRLQEFSSQRTKEFKEKILKVSKK